MNEVKPLLVYERPVCNYEIPTRCRKTAIVTIDGIWLCNEHKSSDEFARMFAHMARPIVHVRSTR